MITVFLFFKNVLCESIESMIIITINNNQWLLDKCLIQKETTNIKHNNSIVVNIFFDRSSMITEREREREFLINTTNIQSDFVMCYGNKTKQKKNFLQVLSS